VKNTDGESEFPELEYPELTGELREFGAYLHAEPLEAMPTHVWEQIATTISLESADRVVPDSPAALGSDPAVLELESYRKRRIGGKWVGGLVAASVTLFAVGIGVSVLNSDSSDQNSVVADAPLPEDQVADSGSLGVASPQIIQAGFVPPSVEIMESGNEYNSSNLRESINQILRKIGVEKPMDMFMAPVQNLEAKKMSKSTGMTGSLESLRKCVTEITNSESSQALFVDGHVHRNGCSYNK
jgi:prepilin-type processing-associated H-X9-DG protein